jgi:Cd2+/Zn2+-exporting ATPase
MKQGECCKPCAGPEFTQGAHRGCADLRTDHTCAGPEFTQGAHLAVSEIRVDGLDCPDEAHLIRPVLVALRGVKDVQFELATSTAFVTYDTRVIGERDLLAAVRGTGFSAEPAGPIITGLERPNLAREAGIVLGAMLVVFAMAWCAVSKRSVLAGLVCEVSPIHLPAAFWALVGAIALSWWSVLPKAWRSARALRPDLHLLMTIAVLGAMCLGQWFEAATVAVLFGVANRLESWSGQRIRRAVVDLFSQVPSYARLKTAEAETLVPADQVRVGDVVLVLPGERIPLDGKVVAGEGCVDQSPITGESRPLPKTVGGEVFAGSINQDAALAVQATRPASQSLMAQVIRLVRQGQANKSRRERIVDRFARYYTPIVLAGAVLIAVLLPPLGVLAWRDAIMRALVLLVISCPCALVISTPVAVVSALTALVRGGALVKAGRFLEVLAGVKVIALDKTGTLTLGRPAVDGVIPLDSGRADEVLRIAACVESRSEHSLGRAIVDAARQRGLPIEPCLDFTALPGMGAMGRVGGETFLVGNPRLLGQRGIPVDAIQEHVARHEGCHHTAMLVASQDRPIGIILAADRIRPQTHAAVRELHAAGIRTVMLTGDNRGTARAIAEQSGVDDFHAELLPAEKVEVLSRLRREHGCVAMVGDGINDAPALAAADVGIAMGTIGTDVAIETADVALMSDNPWHLPWLMRHARKTRRTILANVVLAVGLKAAFLVLGAVGLANLWMAIGADMGASLAVTFNGMRLLAAPHPPEPPRDQDVSFEGRRSGPC